MNCPPDRGHPGFMGTVVAIDPEVATNQQGIHYQWLFVKDRSGRVAWWPSHRLGFKAPEHPHLVPTGLSMIGTFI